MRVIGDKSTFAFEISESQIESGNLCTVNIYIDNKNICPFDNQAYLPAFVNSLKCSANYLKSKIDYIKFEHHFIGLNAIEAHQLLRKIRHEDFDSQKFEDEMYDFHRFIDWGETTDDVCCFPIPIRGFLCLTCELWWNIDSEIETGIIYGAEVTPYQLITTIESAIDILKTKM